MHILILISLTLGYLRAKEIFIDYGLSQEMFKYFHHIQDQFYLDIGAYHPIHKSNTLALYAQGWQGINVEASPSRINSFFFLRAGDVNLNTAVGKPDTYVTLHEMPDDSTSRSVTMLQLIWRESVV